MSEVDRGELTDETWPRTERLNKDHRPILNAIRWVLRTGAPWADLPPGYGQWRTVASRFYRWSAAGVWPRVLEALLLRGVSRW